MQQGLNFLGEAFKKKTEKSKEDKERRNKFFNKKMQFGEQDMKEVMKVFDLLGADGRVGTGAFRQNQDIVRNKVKKIVDDFRGKSAGSAVDVSTGKGGDKGQNPPEHNKEVMINRCDMTDMLFDPIVDVAKGYSENFATGLKATFDIIRRMLDNYVEYIKAANHPANFALNNQHYVNISGSAFGKTQESLLENAGFDKETW